jgi:hypothetical protein
MNNNKFKKGDLSRDAFSVIMHDLECLDLRANVKDNEYHYNLLKQNLKDIFGIKNSRVQEE